MIRIMITPDTMFDWWVMMVRLFLAVAMTIIIIYNHDALRPYHTVLVIPSLFHGHAAGWLVEQHCTAQSQNSKPMHVLEDTKKITILIPITSYLYSCDLPHVVSAISAQIMINILGQGYHPFMTPHHNHHPSKHPNQQWQKHALLGCFEVGPTVVMPWVHASSIYLFPCKSW